MGLFKKQMVKERLAKKKLKIFCILKILFLSIMSLFSFALFYSLFLFISLIFITPQVQASDEQAKETLVRIIQQLHNIKPLISKAQREQSPNLRIKVHFDRFKGADGRWHNGLRQDVDSIQQALVRIVNQESIEPRNFEPIGDDFIG